MTVFHAIVKGRRVTLIMKILRRDFVKLLRNTTAFGLAFNYGLFTHIPVGHKRDAFANPVDDMRLHPPEEKWVPSVCQQCQGGCGILVRVYGERAVKIDGNPVHPINRGRLCARGQSGLQYLYDPDRITGPMIREGERGQGKWKAISWEDAINKLSDQLMDLRNQGKPQSLTVLTSPQRGLTRSVMERFMQAYGSPNLIRYQNDRSQGMSPAVNLMQGFTAGTTYDIENTNYILSLNSGLLEDHWSPVQLYQAYGKFRQSRNKTRGKMVHFEPRLSVTGAKADQWIPIQPGSEGVLAMGIASVLIIEKRYNEEFIEERTFGFHDWKDEEGTLHPGFKTLVIQDYPLNKVVKITGVPRDTIITTAREFADLKPSLAMGNDSEWVGYQGVYNRMAIHALNALVGNIQETGGLLSNAQIPEMPLPRYTPDSTAMKGLSMPRIDGAGRGRYALVQDVPANLPEVIQNKNPYPIEMLFLYGANPVYHSTVSESYVSALKQIPSIVSFASFMDETTQYADLILPDSIYLEKWQLDTSYTLKGNPVVSVAQPVVAPTHNTREISEVLVSLTKTMGKSLSNAFPYTKTDDLIKVSIQTLHTSARGEAFGAPLEELWTKLLEQSGWKVRSRETFDTFWNDFKTKGGWWDPVYYPWEWKRVFSTPSERFEFYSLTAQKFLNDLEGMDRDLALQRTILPVNMESADAACLPYVNQEATKGNPILYNLEVHPYPIPILNGLTHTNQPWLQDITGFHLYKHWHTWVEIHPETAHEMGVHEGDWVMVESQHGKIKAQVKFFEGAMPGVINLPVGLGHTSGGRWTEGIGENTLQVLRNEREFFTGRFQILRTRARLVKTDA